MMSILFVSPPHMLGGYPSLLGLLDTVLRHDLGDLTQSISRDMRPVG